MALLRPSADFLNRLLAEQSALCTDAEGLKISASAIPISPHQIAPTIGRWSCKPPTVDHDGVAAVIPTSSHQIDPMFDRWNCEPPAIDFDSNTDVISANELCSGANIAPQDDIHSINIPVQATEILNWIAENCATVSAIPL